MNFDDFCKNDNNFNSADDMEKKISLGIHMLIKPTLFFRRMEMLTHKNERNRFNLIYDKFLQFEDYKFRVSIHILKV